MNRKNAAKRNNGQDTTRFEIVNKTFTVCNNLNREILFHELINHGQVATLPVNETQVVGSLST